MLNKIIRFLTVPSQEDYLNAKARYINKKYNKYRQKDSCKKGYHVPVRMLAEGEETEYFCQNCATDMTEQEWRNFFEGTEIGQFTEELAEYYR